MNSRNPRAQHAFDAVRQPSRTARVLARCLSVLTGVPAKTDKQVEERFTALTPDQRVRELGEW